MIFLAMGLLLLVAKIFGEIAEELGMAPLIGEVLAGVLLAAVFGVTLGAFTTNFLMFGVVILLFFAGLNVKYDDIKHNIYQASMIVTGGVMLTFLLSLAIGVFMFNSIIIGVALGAILVSTSDAVVFSILMKTGNMKTIVGRMVVSATIVDDVAGILFLSLMMITVGAGSVSFSQIWSLLMISIGFYVVLLLAGSKIMNVVLKIFSTFRDEQVALALPLVIAFLVAVVSENIGLGMATGAFIAGMMMANSKYTETSILPRIKIISNGFIVPLFFAAIGTMMILKEINWILVGIILAVAMIGKFIGCSMTSYALRFRGNEAKFIGLSMIPRSDYNIIVAQIALTLGIITISIFTSVVMTIIFTMIIAPILIRAFVKRMYY
jgi:Kef-type K+ transport system membrane component KefB